MKFHVDRSGTPRPDWVILHVGRSPGLQIQRLAPQRATHLPGFASGWRALSGHGRGGGCVSA